MNNNLQKIKLIIEDYKNKSNNELIIAMDHLNADFDLLKNNILKMTEQLDQIESIYNKLLEEYKKRNNVTG